MVTLLDREGKAVELDAPCWKLSPNRVETLKHKKLDHGDHEYLGTGLCQ